MQIKKGIPVSPGVAIARAVVMDAEDAAIPRRMVSQRQVPLELDRIDKALEASRNDIESLRDQASTSVGAEVAKIFDVHLAMLNDQSTIDQIRQTVEAEHTTAEYAVYRVMRQIASIFSGQQDRYLRERANDIQDLERRLLGHLIGDARAGLAELDHEAILIAHDLTPSQTAALDKSKIKGIATDMGGQTSHTAILAHALGIPAIVGLEEITAAVSTGDNLILDGNRGRVLIDPDAEQLLAFREYSEQIKAFESTLTELKDLPAETKDGTEVKLHANIEFPNEIAPALEKGAVGIGLYRTEFLFLASQDEPSEQEQYDAYSQAIEALDGRPLTIRTLDLGADKVWRPDALEYTERNPFLGCRSIRMCLQNLPMFKTQLRAILRASANGPCRIMFPLISNIMELRQAKMVLTDVMEDLDDQGVEYREDIPVGIMVEVPSVALQAAVFAREVDFFSIGTNDLIQYTVAVDRGNERIASLYSAAHPAVSQLIRDVVRAANHSKVDVSLCGEMGGEPEFIMPLIGMGIRSLSITPPAIPEVKKVIRSVSIDKCKRVARKVASFDTDREVINYLRDELRKVMPEGVLDAGFAG